MAEQVFRQPLALVTVAQPNPNVDTKISGLSPSKGVKRTFEGAALGQAKAVHCGTVTPTKASATTATNGRRSVKRFKPDPSLRENAEEHAETHRAKAEEEHATKLKIWIASYKRSFPSLRFFFDACSDDDVRRCTRRIVMLGGRVEPFFSNSVNVVVTTREVPKTSEPAVRPPDHADESRLNGLTPAQRGLVQQATQYNSKIPSSLARPDSLNQDILIKAQSLNIKIWSLRKLRDSVLKNLLAEQPAAPNQRSLSNTLRTEKFIGASEENIVQFKGPYVLVRDMNEQYRPIMCREWPTASNPKDGTWPQWRTTRMGRCPFIRDKHAEDNKDSLRVTQVRPERPLAVSQLQHANASGIQQITSAIQSHIGRSGWSGKENIGSGVANLHKKAVTTAKKSAKVNPKFDPTDTKKVKVDLKAGYCENCRDKFDDFDLHLRSRSHRAYAKNEANFYDLDALLSHLTREPRVEQAMSI